MKKYLLILLTIIMMLTLACSFSVDLPKAKTFEDMTLPISEAPPSDHGQLSILMGGGKLELNHGVEDWVSGQIDYNVPIWAPKVTRNGNSVIIEQKTKGTLGVPSEKIRNDWLINIGDVPTDLTIKAGAYEGTLNLGGIPLTSLNILDGASKSDITFDQLNPVEMDKFSYKTGASQIAINGLANAYLSQFKFEGGAGAYTFDFSGHLQKAMDIQINYGLGDVKIIIPKGVPATISVDGGLNNVELTGTWNIAGNVFQLAGNGPELVFHVKMGLGNLQLISQ